MKTVIAGSRDVMRVDCLERLDFLNVHSITEIVSGTARGADKVGEEWARENGIPIKQFPANWDKHGKSAGYMRNKEMVDYADQVIVLWDGKSKGTKHTMDLTKKAGKPLLIILTSYTP